MDAIQAVMNLSVKNTEQSSEREWRQMQCDDMNRKTRNDPDYNCPLCGNKGVIFRVTDDCEIVGTPCKCKATRDSIRRMRRSGLESVIRKCTFDAYIAKEPWQQNILTKAKSFANDPTGWFFIGGQVGCGKSHICTAIIRKLLLEGMECRYFPWRDVTTLKGMFGEEYKDAVSELKNVKVLYIDDLFKGGTEEKNGTVRPTQADINIAFEIINHRYINRNLITLFSSEKSVDDIMDIDMAVGSRIYEMSKNHCIEVGRDQSRNYRTAEA